MPANSSSVKASSISFVAKSKLSASDNKDNASPSVGNFSISAYLSSASDFVAAATAAKCNLCHFATPESKSKKQKNDFGKELAKHLSKKNYTSTRIREEAAAVSKEFDAAFAKVMAAKNPKGKTYQSRVDAGELPGSINEK